MSKHFFVEDDVEARDSLKSKEKKIKELINFGWESYRENEHFLDRIESKTKYLRNKNKIFRNKLMKFRE